MGRRRSTCECLLVIFYNTYPYLNMDVDPYIDIYYFDLKLDLKLDLKFYLVCCSYELQCYCRSILRSTLELNCFMVGSYPTFRWMVWA
jgi:hypothetical protein